MESCPGTGKKPARAYGANFCPDCFRAVVDRNVTPSHKDQRLDPIENRGRAGRPRKDQAAA